MAQAHIQRVGGGYQQPRLYGQTNQNQDAQQKSYNGQLTHGGGSSYSLHQQFNDRSASAYSGIPPSTMGARSYSRTSLGGGLGGVSRSLRASKASLASVASHKSTIQQEYHDIKARKTLTAAWYGKAKTPFRIALAFFIIGVLVAATGLTIIACRAVGWLFLSTDKGDFIGPGILVFGFILIAVGIKFIYDAYKISGQERQRIKFTPASESMVNISKVNLGKKAELQQVEKFEFSSGTATRNAITRAPLGSQHSLANI